MRPTLNEEARGEMEEFQGRDLNWEYILDKARRDRVSPLLYHNLTEIGRDGYHLPQDILEEFKRDYYTNATRNILIYKELEQIVEALQAEGIKIIVLQGASLAEQLYHNIALRPIGDIDVLIRKNDLAIAHRKLSELGYLLEYHSEIGGERYYLKPGPLSIRLDIHWATWYCPFNESWENVEEIKVGETTSLTLAPEDLLISLTTHSAIHHGTGGGIWLVDIALVISQYRDKLNWKEFFRKVRDRGVDVPLYYLLHYAKERLGAEVPLEVLKALKPPGSKFLEARIYQFVLNSDPVADIRPLLHPLISKGVLGKIKFLSAFVFPPPEFMRCRYGFSGHLKAPLYYLVRPFSLFLRLTGLLSHLFF